MRQIVLVNEVGIPEADMANFVIMAQRYADRVTRAWGQEAVKVGTTQSEGSWNIYLTERLRERQSKGHHNVKNGVPFAWVSPKSVLNKPYGTYYPPFVRSAVMMGKVQIMPARNRPAVHRDGIITIICHEMGEMIIDPIVETFSPPDSLGRSWLIEICAHIYGSYFTETINGKVCVFHNFTFPAYYDVNGVAPFSLIPAVKAPFERTPTSYAYYKNELGILTKIV